MRLPRLTRRLTIIIGTIIAGIVAAFWTICFFAAHDPERTEAVALFDQIRPDMTITEFLEFTKDEPITDDVRRDFPSSAEEWSRRNIPGACRWVHGGRFDFIVVFDGGGHMKQKLVREQGFNEIPRIRSYAHKYLGFPLPKLHRYRDWQ